MDIRVSGHQVETGNALKEHVWTRLEAVAEKYFARAISAQVTFRKAPHGAFHCDIVCHVMTGLILKGAGEAQEAHPAFDIAADRIEKQLRRYMRRLKDRHVQAAAAEAVRSDPVNGGLNGHALNGFDNAGYTVFAGYDDEEEPSDAPLIVAETRVDIPQASVSDAVMMLDLRNTNALLFVNAGTSAYNMVYRRHDGTIGWVEPTVAVAN
ncbi:ribosome-associated translation inhibitor RaiA [Sphingobium phenoxybenzoativorans]|uniref:Ribosome hibernation promoting factor n=1 Tax=Sphingobium phenoxybenzoativorans TaxID=1592790 RepID=A0A975K7V9_9SPHN|nr:ribosome-associated translation inhibitor RaiA [Sphingobium phenoxybenzoativorans]QUT06107.1 ribosome-associated translation inhibitor RaiA [Sphingobium phenoxybenzoativorans]